VPEPVLTQLRDTGLFGQVRPLGFDM
jgi:hypothetical protein